MGEKPLGYPPGKRDRKVLEKAWVIAFEALDIRDFEGFLREHERETQSEALQDIDKIALYQSEKQLIEKGKTAEAEGVLGQHDSIIKDMQQQGLEYQAQGYTSLLEDYEKLKNEYATLKKRKAAEKREPKQKPLVIPIIEKVHPALSKKEVPISLAFGEDYDRILEMIRIDGEKNLQDAKALLKDKNTRLTEADRFELSELLTTTEQGITPMKAPERIHKPVMPKPEISTTRTRERKKREEKGEEEFPEFRAITHDISKLNIRNADVWLRTYHKYIPEMLIMGIPAWLKKHPEAEKFPISLAALRLLAQQLSRMYQPLDPYTDPPVREIEAQRLLSSKIYQLVGSGLEDVVDGYDFERWYTQYKHMAEFEPFKKYVIEAVPGTARKIFKL